MSRPQAAVSVPVLPHLRSPSFSLCSALVTATRNLGGALVIPGPSSSFLCHRLGTNVRYMVSRNCCVVPNVIKASTLAMAPGVSSAKSLLARSALKSGASREASASISAWPVSWTITVLNSNMLLGVARSDGHQTILASNRVHGQRSRSVVDLPETSECNA